MNEAPFTQESIDAIDSLQGAANALKILKESARGSSREKKGDDFLTLRILERASELGDLEVETLSEFLRQEVVPLCCAEPDDTAAGLHTRYRELLRDWIESLPQRVLWPVRAAVIDELIVQLTTRPTDDAMYTLSTVGLREPRTIKALRYISRQQNELGDRALRLIVGMTPSGSLRKAVVTQIRRRLRARPTEETLNAAAMLGDAELVDLLTEVQARERESWFRFSRYSWIADHAPGDLQYQDLVWNAVGSLRDHVEGGWQSLLLSGGLIRECHSPRAIKDIVGALPLLTELGDIHVWRWFHQIERCRSRVQVLGWQQVEPEPIVSCLKIMATRPSGQQGRWADTGGTVKRDSLRTLLSLGDRSVMNWADDVLSSETNPFVAHECLKILAVLSFGSLPPSVEAIIDRQLDLLRQQDSEETVRFLGAAKVVASSAHLSSLELLVRCRVTSEGHPFLSPIEDGAALAAHLFVRGEARVLNVLGLAIGATENPSGISIALRGVRLIAGKADIPGWLREAVERVTRSSELESYIRQDAVEAVAAIAHRMKDRSLHTRLRELLDDSDDRVGQAALRVLVLLETPEGLRNDPPKVALPTPTPETVSAGETVPESIAVVLGYLATRVPERYLADAARLIEAGSEWTVEAIVWGVRQGASAGMPLDDRLTTSLIVFIRRRESWLMSNSPLIKALASLSPRRFLMEDWHKDWHEWMPESRKSLADGMRKAAELMADDGALVDRACMVLQLLLGDPTFAVRRSAARALSQVSPRRLRGWCLDAIESGSIEARRIAAYASGWLPLDAYTTLDNDLVRQFLGDEEQSVRRAAKLARDEARSRHWATELLNLVRKPHPDSNEWVLRAYAASRALINVGDDSDIEELSRLSRSHDLPPNVRHWLQRTLEELESQWKETTGKWPDPWLPWEGTVERVAGRIKTANHDQQAKFTLWRKRGFGDELSDWGGFVSADPVRNLMISFDEAETMTIEIEGRQIATAVATKGIAGGLFFAGSGNYPQPL